MLKGYAPGNKPAGKGNTRNLVVVEDEEAAAAQAALRGGRDARLQLARAHPLFWAPFVHVGD